jgi:imidazolonepropionase-like amidohydrolase
VPHNYFDNRAGFPAFTPQTLETLEKGIAPMADALKRARARKVKIVFGTDAVAGAHGRNAEEFVYRVKEAGEKAADVLVSARGRCRPNRSAWGIALARSPWATRPTSSRPRATRSTTSPPSAASAS